MLINFSRYLSTFLMIVICGSITQAQTTTLQLVPESKHTYTDGVTQAKLHKFESFFSHDLDKAELFSQFNSNRKTQRWINHIAGIPLGLSLIGSTTDRDAITVTNGVLVAIVGLGNAITASAKKRAKKKLLFTKRLPDNLEELEYVNINSPLSVELSQLSKNIFIADGQARSLHKFEYLFKDNVELKESFDLFNSYRKKQKNVNIITASITVTTIALVVPRFEGEDFAVLGVLLYAGGFVSTGGLIVWLNDTINGTKKRQFRSRLLSQIDPSMVFKPQRKATLNLASTQNGVGLVYQF